MLLPFQVNYRNYYSSFPFSSLALSLCFSCIFQLQFKEVPLTAMLLQFFPMPPFKSEVGEEEELLELVTDSNCSRRRRRRKINDEKDEV